MSLKLLVSEQHRYLPQDPSHLDARVFDGLTHPADNERIELVVHLIIFKVELP